MDYKYQSYCWFNNLDSESNEESPLYQRKKWYLFELYMCYKTCVIPWHFISIDTKEKWNVHVKDHGIDGITEDGTISVQAKYRNNTSITYTELCTFFGLSSILDCKQKILGCLQTSKISKQNIQYMDRFGMTNQIVDDGWEDEMKKLSDQYVIPEIVETTIKLRPYQIEALNVCKQEKKSIKISFPCGGGKSIVIIEVGLWCKENNRKCVIFVPGLTLMNQLYKMFKTYSKKKLNILRIGTGFNEMENEYDIIICVYNSWKKVDEICEISESCCIVDEGHHLEKFEDESEEEKKESDDDFITFEDEGESEKGHLEGISSLSFQKEIHFSATFGNSNIDYTYTLEDAIEQGYLCDYDIIVPVVDKEISVDIPKVLVDLLYKRQDLTKILAYCNSRDSGKKFTQLLNDNGIKSKFVDGTMNIKKRQEIINSFTKGDIRVIVSVYVFGEGLDIPCADTCLFVEPRHSRINIIQCIGRIMRLHKNKTIGHVILPTDREDTCVKFFKILRDWDSRVKSSLKEKRLGRITFENIKEIEIETGDVDYYIDIYNRFGEIKGWDDKYSIYRRAVVEVGIKFVYSTVFEGEKIGSWESDQRKIYKKEKLSDERKEKLDKIPRWKAWREKEDLSEKKEKKNLTWDDKYEIYSRAVVEVGNKFDRSTVFEGEKIGNWESKQRMNYKTEKLSDERKEKLDKISRWREWREKSGC
ncbi:MAG: helicase-related protein [Candidatus Colwellbacteria bacterium]|nr:helicase-related protein [Candidatus Colwellbacteria bacterium]